MATNGDFHMATDSNPVTGTPPPQRADDPDFATYLWVQAATGCRRGGRAVL